MAPTASVISPLSRLVDFYKGRSFSFVPVIFPGSSVKQDPHLCTWGPGRNPKAILAPGNITFLLLACLALKILVEQLEVLMKMKKLKIYIFYLL